MVTQNGAGHLGGYVFQHGIMDGLGLVRAGGNEHHLPGTHNGADAEAYRLPRHFVGAVEKARIGFNGALAQRDQVATVHEAIPGLVEADVSIAANAQQLNVNAARRLNGGIIRAGRRSQITGRATGHMDGLRAHVHMLEQLLHHEGVVAAGMLRRKPYILV